MHPILNGESGFVLLALVVGLGAYIRQVYVDAESLCDKLKSGELEPLWPKQAQYTKDRLANLTYVQHSLIRATRLMFLFIILMCLRLIAIAIAVIPTDIACSLNYLRIPTGSFYFIDLLLLLFLTVAFLMMWWTHHKGGQKERELREVMWAAFPGASP